MSVISTLIPARCRTTITTGEVNCRRISSTSPRPVAGLRSGDRAAAYPAGQDALGSASAVRLVFGPRRVLMISSGVRWRHSNRIRRSARWKLANGSFVAFSAGLARLGAAPRFKFRVHPHWPCHAGGESWPTTQWIRNVQATAQL
jgi:hypothetical protein